MEPEWWPKAEADINTAVANFSIKLQEGLEVPPRRLMSRANPFLLYIRTAPSDADTLAQMVIDAYLVKSAQTKFGKVLEDIALCVCKHSKGGRKSAAEEMDLEYDSGNERTIVQIKSGISWGNSSQHAAQERAFEKAARILRQGDKSVKIRCIVGSCYGPSGITDKGTHQKVVGRDFWEEISGWAGTSDAVLDIIGKHSSNGLFDARRKACERLIEFLKTSKAIDSDGGVRWHRILEINMDCAQKHVR
ncbi:MAG: PmeII family type II restriction endonuclease [Thaumarchaeota archaeon]|nr:PmeII family type II restriction endonuclease [Nitrososphaerota archaeon]